MAVDTKTGDPPRIQWHIDAGIVPYRTDTFGTVVVIKSAFDPV